MALRVLLYPFAYLPFGAPYQIRPTRASLPRMAKVRLDERVLALGLVPSREKAKAHILAGEIWLGQKRLDKPGLLVDPEAALELRSHKPAFASRAGEKLEHALRVFGVNVSDRACLDIGASTGGFTHCLLKNGARAVLAVDVGKGQLDQPLRNDPKVTVLDETNARHLTSQLLEEKFPAAKQASLITMDVSFISLKKVIEPLRRECSHVRDWVLLFKPQFEVGPKFIGKGGVVRSQEAVDEALTQFHEWMLDAGFTRAGGPEISPVVGKKSGNVEYLLHYVLAKPPQS